MFFYSVSEIASFFRCSTPPLLDVHSAIMNAGFEVSISHTCPTSLKTNAPITLIYDIFKFWIKSNPIKVDGQEGPRELILKSPIM